MPILNKPLGRAATAAFVVCFASAGFASADVKMPSIFGDHMVLQQEAKLPVWGTAAPGEAVSVTVGDHTASAAAGEDGKWRVDLEPFPNAAPATTMSVKGKNTLEFKDVLIGDVWVASGQSNMAAAVSYATNSAAEAKAKDPDLRLFLVAETPSLQPMSDVTSPFDWKPFSNQKPAASDGDRPGTWIVCEPHAVMRFSAVAYYFGKELRAHLKRPIGVIGTYWPGTEAEAWMSLASLHKAPPFKSYVQAYEQNVAAYPKLKEAYDKSNAVYQADLKDYESKLSSALKDWQTANKAWTEAAKQAAAAGQPAPPNKPPIRPELPVRPKAPDTPEGGRHGPGNLFNGMIAPLIPLRIKGVIWYQGEGNTRTKAWEYRLLFPRLIADWREQWGQGDFPFLYVQISHFSYAKDQTCALIREAQLRALSVPNTAMAVTVDIPYDDPGHPHDKIDPAHRLALAAEHVAYGENVPYCGPLYKSMEVDGASIRIHFTEAGSGLMIGKPPYQPPFDGKVAATMPTDALVGFTIAGADEKFVKAEAKIEGDSVVVSAAAVTKPVAVRFAWGDRVECNLYNKENLPASPFRTDEWDDFKYAELAPGINPPTFSATSRPPTP